VLRRLERLPQRLQMEAVLPRVARTASRHDVRSGRLATIGARDDVVERRSPRMCCSPQYWQRKRSRRKTLNREGDSSRGPHVLTERD
jgi:hypothetical protein